MFLFKLTYLSLYLTVCNDFCTHLKDLDEIYKNIPTIIMNGQPQTEKNILYYYDV